MKSILLSLFLIPLAIHSQIFFAGFEDGLVPPTGWTLNSTNNQYTWTINADAVPDGIGAAQVDYDPTPADQNEDLITSSIDLSGVSFPFLYFKTASSYYWGVSPLNNYDISVSISTDDGVSWTEIWNEDELATAEGGQFITWKSYLIKEDLSAYAGMSNVKLKFNYTGNDGAQWVIDSVRIMECADVTGVTIDTDSYTTSSFALDWDDTHTSYDIEFGPADFTVGSGTIVTGITNSNYEITGLEEATAYDVYIKGNCSSTVSGAPYVLESVYTALDDTTTLDYTYDFDTEKPVHAEGWTNINNGNGNAWQMITFQPNAQSGDSYMWYAFDPDNAADAWLFSRGIELSAGQMMKVSFYYRIATEGAQEKLKVTIGNSPTVASQTTTLWDNNGGTSITNPSWEMGEVTYTAPADGVYYVAYNCYSNANSDFVYLDSTSFTETLGVVDLLKNPEISIVYPNPAQDVVKITLSDSFNKDSTKVIITDMSGRKLMQSAFTESLDIAHLLPGMYLLTLTDGKYAENLKLIKE